jgi:predicted Zn-dependent peptidase
LAGKPLQCERLRYGTALNLTSSEAVASFLAPYVALRRSPETIDKSFALYDRITPAVQAMLLDPGFRPDDFARLKADAINYLKVSLREGNDEELGKEELYRRIYDGLAYGHHNLGTVRSLGKLTLDDVRAFGQTQFTQGNLVIGLAGHW